MPITFDLSKLNQPDPAPPPAQPPHPQLSFSAVGGALPSASVAAFAPTAPTAPTAPVAPPQFTFTIGNNSPTSPWTSPYATGATGLVRRFASPVLQRIGLATGAPVDPTKCDRADDEENDQYTVRPGHNLWWSVLFRNDTGRKHPKSILGDFGHAERLPAWIHLISSVAFLVYGVLRPTLITKIHTAAETWTTVAVFASAFCFASSTVYHVTSPSRSLAYFTRQLDFAGIYLALSLGYVADYAIATLSFTNTSVLSVIDAPAAALLTFGFFIARRGLLPAEETWSSYLGGCTLNFGLFRRMHIDKSHTGTRQATSFILAVASFVSAPALFRSIGTNNALVVLALEVSCLLFVIVGMTLDNATQWPDLSLSRGRGPRFLICKPCGCVGSAHSIWHLLTVVAAVKVAVGRELALSWS